jgi:hypothetical protein
MKLSPVSSCSKPGRAWLQGGTRLGHVAPIRPGRVGSRVRPAQPDGDCVIDHHLRTQLFAAGCCAGARLGDCDRWDAGHSHAGLERICFPHGTAGPESRHRIWRPDRIELRARSDTGTDRLQELTGAGRVRDLLWCAHARPCCTLRSEIDPTRARGIEAGRQALARLNSYPNRRSLLSPPTLPASQVTALLQVWKRENLR